MIILKAIEDMNTTLLASAVINLIFNRSVSGYGVDLSL
jgi:hypothetical protein